MHYLQIFSYSFRNLNTFRYHLEKLEYLSEIAGPCSTLSPPPQHLASPCLPIDTLSVGTSHSRFIRPCTTSGAFIISLPSWFPVPPHCPRRHYIILLRRHLSSGLRPPLPSLAITAAAAAALATYLRVRGIHPIHNPSSPIGDVRPGSLFPARKPS
jgi:hypothetical protein